MKMTMHIDDALLERVMAATGAANKTHAVDIALREVDRRAELVRLTKEGLGLTPAELRETIDPTYDLEGMRLKESPARYGRKPRSRR
jgi:Arc/MetJ family transcription regulator